MKKICTIIICFGMFMFISLFSNNSFFVKANSKYNTYLDNNEEKVIQEIVNDKLGIMEYSINFISGISDLNRYVLIEGVNSYLIYDRELCDYIEFSNSTNSMYYLESNDVEKVYLGPTYYYKYENNQLIDLSNSEIVTDVEIEKLELLEIQFKEIYSNNKEIKQLYNNSTNLIRNFAPNGPVYIQDRYYFDNLKNNMGSNSPTSFSGSCSYVAIGMMLSYYDTIVNDNVIVESYDVNSYYNFTDYSAINVQAYYQSPGIDDFFHSDLIDYGISHGYTTAGDVSISVNNMDDLLNDYFEDINMSITTHNVDQINIFVDKVNFCKEAIAAGKPVIIAIHGTDPLLDSRNLKHDVIGYGYDDTGIYVNFGWKGTNINVNINNYSIPRAFYIDLNEGHSCSNNYTWECNGCTGTICSCGLITCNHEIRSNVLYDSINHKNQCDACNEYELEAHNFYISNQYKICGDCGYQEHIHSFNYYFEPFNEIFHEAYCSCGVGMNIVHNFVAGLCTDCGEEEPTTHVHNYIYISCKDGKTHRKSCLCGFSQVEPCRGLYEPGSPTVCVNCNQIMTNGGLILKKEDEEIFLYLKNEEFD